MYPYDPDALARSLIEDRLRDANHRRLARESQRREQPSAARTSALTPWRRSRLLRRVHLHRVYS